FGALPMNLLSMNPSHEGRSNIIRLDKSRERGCLSRFYQFSFCAGDFPQSRLRSTRPRRLRSKSSWPMASRAPVHPDGTGHIFTGKFREPCRSSPSQRLKLRDSTSIGSPLLEPAVFLLRFSQAFCLGSDSAGSSAFSVERWFDYVSQSSR